MIRTYKYRLRPNRAQTSALESLFTQARRTETLEPGETATYRRRWEAPEPGRYLAVATLAAEHADVEARAEFEW